MIKLNVMCFIILTLSLNYALASDDFTFPLGVLKVSIAPLPKNVSKATKEISGQDMHILSFDNNTIYVWQNEIIFNKLSYGKFKDTDKISIIEGKFWVNNAPVIGGQVSDAMQMFLDQSEDYSIQKMGNHYVAVYTVSGINIYTKTSECNIERHEYIAGDKTIVIENDTLYVNISCYGKVPESSGVVINEDGVKFEPLK